MSFDRSQETEKMSDSSLVISQVGHSKLYHQKETQYNNRMVKKSMPFIVPRHGIYFHVPKYLIIFNQLYRMTCAYVCCCVISDFWSCVCL